MRAQIVNQSSDFPVRRTGSYRHNKHWILDKMSMTNCYIQCQQVSSPPLKLLRYFHMWRTCVIERYLRYRSGIPAFIPILVYLSEYLYELYHFY